MITIPEEGAFGRETVRTLSMCAQTMLAAEPRLQAIAVAIGFSNKVKGDVFTAEISYEGITDEDDIDLLPLVRRFERHAARAGFDLPLGDDEASPVLSMLFGRDRIDLRVGEDEIDISLVAERIGGDWICHAVIDASLDADYPLTTAAGEPEIILADALTPTRLIEPVDPGTIRVIPLEGHSVWRITMPVAALRLGGGEMWTGGDE